MTRRQFYDWQTAGGGGDVVLLIEALEKAQVPWCVIGGLAVNHWALEPMATLDVDLAVATDAIDKAVRALEAAGFRSKRFDWSVNLTGHSDVSIQISTESIYQGFPQRAVSAEVHGIRMPVACLTDTLQGKILAWRDKSRRPSKRRKDLLDITRLVEAHPELQSTLPADIADRLREP
jgi:hypothetical protein